MIPCPVYDEDTGAYIPQEWERFIPAGCRTEDGSISKEGAWEIETRDPTATESEIAGVVARVSLWMEKGILPLPGGLLAQPARLLRAVEAWRGAVDECNARLLARKGVKP